MNVYLDDVRGYPNKEGQWRNPFDLEGVVWTIVRTVADCIALLEKGGVERLSLDHDLGETDPHHEGYDVLLWLERQAFEFGNLDVIPADIRIHTANMGAERRMRQAEEVIRRKREELLSQREET